MRHAPLLLLLAACVGTLEDLDATCDAECIGSLLITLPDEAGDTELVVLADGTTFTVDCGTGAIDGPAGTEVTCAGRSVTITVPSFEWPAALMIEQSGNTWNLDALTTDVGLCGTFCTEASVQVPTST